jgi:hypothetical protein
MGTWGTGIMDNDLAADARYVFEDAIDEGQPVERAIELVRQELAEPLADQDEYLDVILALAWLASAHGPVPQALRDEAVEVIRGGRSLKKWTESDDYEERRAVEHHLLLILEGKTAHPEADGGQQEE